jgi:hypothetical protein
MCSLESLNLNVERLVIDGKKVNDRYTFEVRFLLIGWLQEDLYK